MNGLGRVACGLLLFTGLACGRAELSDAEDPATLIVGVPDDAATFDSVFASTPRSVGVIMNTYETLMTHSSELNAQGLRHWIPERLEGAALESMTVADDGVTWNLKVRPGVRFPSGHTVDAEAVKRVFDRQFRCRRFGRRVSLSKLGACPRSGSGRGHHSRHCSDHNRSPQPFVTRLLILPNAGALDPELVRSKSEPEEKWAENWLRQNTAGAGAYFLDRWTRGVEIVLRANKNYWRGAPSIDKVVMKIIPSAADRMMLLVSGYLDVVERLSAEENDAMARVPGVKVLSLPSPQTVSLVMNCQMPPFDDVTAETSG